MAPKTFPFLNLLSLAFPVLMMVNVMLCLLWIVLWKKRALFFIAISLLMIGPTKRWVNWNSKNLEKPNLKIVSMNIRGGQMGQDKIDHYLESTNADIILIQETGSAKMKLPSYPYLASNYSIVALNSKTKIINQEKLETAGNGNAFFADIEFNGQVIRVVNVYLNPFAFEKEEVKPVEDLSQNKAIAKGILRKLIPTFKIHQDEIVAIKMAIDGSPYPVVVAGDFNAVPNSYEYYTLGKGLTDAFVEVGRGSATSFHDYKFPIRIDYFFSSKEIKPLTYKVDRTLKLSDHFPVIAEFKIN